MIYDFANAIVTNAGRVRARHAYFLPFSDIGVCLDGGKNTFVSDRTFSLNGEWGAAFLPLHAASVDTLNVEFAPITVPFDGRGYVNKDGESEEECLLLEKDFEVFGAERRHFVSIDGVVGDFQVFVNGKFVGSSDLGSGEFDISGLLIEGTNALLLRVCRPSIDFDERVPGVYGNVLLEVKSDAFLTDYDFVCERNDATLVGTLTVTAEGKEGLALSVVFADGEEIISEETAVFENGKATVSFSGAFKTYSAEKPDLYDAYVRLMDGEEEKECSFLSLGFAPVSVAENVIKIDSVNVKIKGAVYCPNGIKDYDDETEIAKSFNLNALYVKGEATPFFYETCAKNGLYVINELPFSFEHKEKTERARKEETESEEVFFAEKAASLVKKTKNYPCVIGYSFGALCETENGKEICKKLSAESGKAVAGVNLTILSGVSCEGGAVIAFAPGDKIQPKELEAIVSDPEIAGVIIDGFGGEGMDGNGLFDEHNVAKESAQITKYAFRPFTASLADNRTLLLTNRNSFASADGVAVVLYKVKGVNEEKIQTIYPVIMPKQTREYGIYVGEYDEHTKLRIFYEKDGAIIASETLRMRKEEELPKRTEKFEAKKCIYTVKNRVFSPDKYEENVLGARSFFIPCSSENVCNAGKSAEQAAISDRVYTLSGEWDFAYYAEKAPVTFGGEAMQWNTISLPCSWENSEYEKFRYAHGYPFKHNLKKFEISDDEDRKNSVGIYRRVVNVADNEFEYTLSFEKVNGSMELQINGEYVGYSMLGTAEFDVTKYLKLGENEIVVIVKKWTPASFLYGEDGFVCTGIIGSVRLIKHRKSGLFDYDFSLKRLGADYLADVKLKFFDNENGTVKVELKKDGKTLFENVCPIKENEAEFVMQNAFTSYNTETSETYDLFIKVVEKNFVTECTKVKVGFNSISVMGDVVYYNEEPLKIRGIGYNCVYNELGGLINADDVRRDLALIKAYGFNAVRPIYYTSPEFTAIACEIGLFVIGGSKVNTKAAAEKNVKSRNAVVSREEFAELIRKIELNACIRDKNACNVPFYAIAEDGKVNAVNACVKAIKELTSRPVFCYGEGAGDGLNVDFPAVNEVVDMINVAADKFPLFFTDFALATGIGCATMNEYEEIIAATPCCLGGCVAYFADDIIKGEGRKACGIFTADRQPYPGAESIRYLYRPLRSELTNNAQAIEITNTRSFVSTSDVFIMLKVISDGKLVSSTRLDIGIPPRSRKKYDVFVGHIEGDMFLNVEYHEKATEKLMYVEQHILNAEMKGIDVKAGVKLLDVTEVFDYVDIAFDCGLVRFNKRLGSIVRYVVGGKDFIKSESVQKGGNGFVTNIRRPFMRNITGKHRATATSKVRKFECDYKKGGTLGSVHVDIENVLSLDGKESYIVSDKYVVHANGTIEVFSVLTPLKRNLPVLDCFGKQIRLNNAFGNVVYYGNGEGDNYIDMCEHTRVGLFDMNVDKTFEKLPVLQECGNRTNVRYAVIRDNDGDGIVVSARKVPFQLRVSPYSDKEISKAYMSGEKPAQSGVYVDVNAFVGGIGSSENGYPLPQYVICSGEHVLNFDIIPVSQCK